MSDKERRHPLEKYDNWYLLFSLLFPIGLLLAVAAIDRLWPLIAAAI